MPATIVAAIAIMYCCFGFRPKRLRGEENSGARQKDAMASRPYTIEIMDGRKHAAPTSTTLPIHVVTIYPEDEILRSETRAIIKVRSTNSVG